MRAALTLPTSDKPLRDEARGFFRGCRVPLLRSIAQFAREEFVFPNGPYQGRHFSRDFQPFAGLYLDLLSEAHACGGWNRFCATGPSQSGKSCIGFVLPTLYHLFECEETVILGVPDADMRGDKWREDLLPAIEASRYRALLPREGAGSRGGNVTAIRFRNGKTLRFLSAGGGDKSRAGFTSRVLVITETDGFDVSSQTSRESDKFSQLEARTRAFGSRKCIYMECTVSTAEGRTWREYQAGTASKIIRPCAQCGLWVSPERRDLHGWQDAETVVQARQQGCFHCPECQAAWSEADRRTANARSRLLHRGQEVTAAGEIVGATPETDTLGFRWSAADNLLVSAGDIAVDEWVAAREIDEENAERKQCQFVWAIPPAPTRWESVPLTAGQLIGRLAATPQGLVPRDSQLLTMAVDVHKYSLYWMAIAWLKGGGGVIIDYGIEKCESDTLGIDQAIYAGLCEIHERVAAGWTWEAHDAQKIPEEVWVDSGWHPRPVYSFVLAHGDRYRAAKGHGTGQQRRAYAAPRKVGGTVIFIGEDWHISWLAEPGLALVEVDANIWKSWTRERLATAIDRPGAMLFYKTLPANHRNLVKQLLSERQEERFIEGKGNQRIWIAWRSNNHWLDTCYNCCAAANLRGLRLLDGKPAAASQPPPEPLFTMPDGRPFLITER